MSGREERPQSSEETQTPLVLTTSTAPPATTVGISEGIVARAHERIQQQAHSSLPSQTSTIRSRTSQLTLGQTSQPQSMLPGMRTYALETTRSVDLMVQQLRQQRQTSARSLIPISSIYREIQPTESETSSVSFAPK